MKRLVHPNTQKQLDSAKLSNNQCFIITGLQGTGKMYLSEYLAEYMLDLSSEKLGTYPFYMHVAPKDRSVGIDSVRGIHKFLHLKTIGHNARYRRVIIIENAHYMTLEAQNALLKTLEEPPTDTIIILTAIKSRKILPTVLSRVQNISIHTPSYSDVSNYFNNVDDSTLQQYYKLSGGSVGMLTDMIKEGPDHPIHANIVQAKNILGNQSYTRLLARDELVSKDQDIEEFIYVLKLIARSGLYQSNASNKPVEAKRWHRILKSANTAETRLESYPNMKLLVTDLLLNL